MATKPNSKDAVPPVNTILPAIQQYINKHGGLESKEEQNKMLRQILGSQYIGGLDEASIDKKLSRIRHDLSSICSSSSIIRVIDVKWQKIEITDKYRLKDLFLSGPSRVYPPAFLEKRGIEVDDESDSEDEGEESEHENQALTRGDKRKAEDSAEDGSMASAGKRQKIRDDSTANAADAGAPSSPAQRLKPIRNGTPVSPQIPQESVSQRAQLSESPQVSRDATRKQWAREAGASEDATLFPTHKPVNPNEIMPRSDAGWATQQMDQVFASIWDATQALFQLNNIKEDADVKLVPKPDSDLRDLYYTLFKSPQWPQVYLRLRMAKQDECLTQEYGVMALMGAAIFKWVFEQESNWDISQEFPKALGQEMTEALSEVIKDLGHDFDTVLKYATAKRITDKKFQEGELADWASRHANALIVIMTPHLEILTQKEEATSAKNYQPWDECLREAFQKAMHVRLILDASELGPFRFIWPTPERKIDERLHKSVYDLSAPSKILVPILPAIARILPDASEPNQHIVFSKARVVPMNFRSRLQVWRMRRSPRRMNEPDGSHETQLTD